MDMELNEEQRHLSETARRFMENECPARVVRELETSDLGFSPDLWRKIAELGWLGLPYPEEYDGYGMGPVDLVVLAKELGRALFPSPYIPTVVLGGGAILAAGTEEQKKTYLPRIAAGQTILAFGLQEASPYYDPRGVATRATVVGDGFVINGSKKFVEFANAADRLLIVARTDGGGASSDGLTMFLVDAKSEGIKLTPLGTMARDRQFNVTLDGVKVSKDDVLGSVGQAWPLLEKVIQRGIVTFCGCMIGASEKIHQMATDFAKERVQFGRPIGSFQAIQHYLAQIIMEIISDDTIVFYAAWALDRDISAREVVAKAKVCAGNTVKQASSIGSSIYGGIGFVQDTDTTLYLRRGKQWQLSMGDGGYWEEVIAEEVLSK
jgi:alkylation response protein AidB-like acyl-CoA dehydrogenase